VVRRVRRQLLRESVLTVSGWTPAVLAAVIGVGLSLGLSFLIPYSFLVSVCRQALQVSDPHAAPYLLAGMAYGVPLALGVWIFRRRVLSGALISSLEASLLFLVILAPYVIAQCREFPPALQVAFVSGLWGGALVSSLAGLGLARLVPFGKIQPYTGGSDMARRLVSFALFALLLGFAVSTGWAQAPVQPKQPEQPAPGPGMPGMMMPMMGDMAQIMQLCAQMMKQMAGIMTPAQPPQPR